MSSDASIDFDRAIVDLVARDAVKVPPYPAVAMRIEQVIRGGDFGLDQVARLVASDQVLAADVLRAANSALFSRGTAVASINGAVTRLGARDVGRIALASGLGAASAARGQLAALRRMVWVDSLASAALCQAMAKGRGIAEDVAFSAGLLHDFGKVVAIACVEDLLAHAAPPPPRPLRAWAELVERFHVELGMVVAARWNLPQVLADAISLHHSDSIKAASDPRIVELLEAVDEVVRLLSVRTHVTGADLEEAELLIDAREREVVERALEGLPSFVASFEGGEPPRPSAGPGAVAPEPAPELPADATAAPLELGAVLTYGDTSREYKVVRIAPTQMILSGTAPVPEHLLLRMEIRSVPPLQGFANVKLCWQERGAHMLLAQPYALTGQALERWRQLATAA